MPVDHAAGDGAPCSNGLDGRNRCTDKIRAESVAPILCLKAAKMSERLETLKKARERMTVDRDGHAKVLAAPFDRDKAERARNKFIEIQVLIDALDRAINGEEGIAPTA
jgi:hypothetical protein